MWFGAELIDFLRPQNDILIFESSNCSQIVWRSWHTNVKNLKTHLENPSRSAFLRNFLTELMRFWSEKVDWSPIWRHFTVCTNLKIEGNPKHSAMEFWLWLKKPHHRVLSVSQPIWGYEGLIRMQLSDFELKFGKRPKYIGKITEFEQISLISIWTRRSLL